VRAGAGSVRDSQSVLGQIIAGAGPEGITYAQTVLQLGFTDEALLSRVVTAIAQADAADLFGLIDEVVSSGHEPRRFVIDLLERLRDLVVLKQVPDAASSGLFDVPAEQIADMAKEAELFTAAQLVRVADLVNSGLSTLRGASSPRLQLELLVARLVTPQVAQDLSERVAKLEQGTPVASIRPSANRVQHAHPIEPQAESPVAETPKVEAAAKPVPPRPVTRPTAPPPMKPSQVTSATPVQDVPPVSVAAPAGTEITLENVKAGWASVLTHLKELRRVSFLILQDTVPLSLTADRVLAVACSSPNNMQGAIKGGHDELLRTAIATVLGADVRIELTVDSARATAKPAVGAPANDIADATDVGDASPDDANVPTHAVIDMVTNIMGGQVISESPRD
jgi:DNA polymerase-3 subunit gamma/tau